MPKKIILLLIVLTVLVGTTYLFRSRSNEAVNTTQSPNTQEETDGKTPIPAHSEGASYAKDQNLKSGEPRAVPSDTPTPANEEVKRESRKPILDLAPTLQTYRDEIAKNPHGAPPSLRKFSEAMAAKMEPALKDQGIARDLLPELSECVKRGTVTAVQQSCLVNAKRLSEKHPDLSVDVKIIEESAPNDVKKRLKLLGM